MKRYRAAAFGLVALLWAGAAVAQGPAGAPAATRTVDGEVLIVLASREAGAIDPRLNGVPALRRSPFDMFRSMALLSSPQVSLTIDEAEVVTLPNGRNVRLVLREITAEGRYRMQLSINRPGQRDYLPELDVVVSPGDPVFIAGQSFQSGTLVIGIRLGRRP